ncbi:unnamed protein product [Porites lobata]|uniref:Uncharacterized protein n=1 Tax=Porites lobata TaxID=104759 RepID=A0ABN8PQS2_9CNID|nr:unnamed protein product [Porites lobata]
MHILRKSCAQRKEYNASAWLLLSTTTLEMLTSVFGEFVDRISVSMHLVLITAYADVDFTKLMASAKTLMNALTAMVFANKLGLHVKTSRAVTVAFANRVFSWTVTEEHVQTTSEEKEYYEARF